jgi:hypothetical protein
MPYTEVYDVIVNKISKALYDQYVQSGEISQAMIENQVWIFSDDQFVSEADIAKLAGIEEGAQVNIIEGISVNGVSQEVGSTKVVNIVVPTKVSDLENDTGFITSTVNNLRNYYSKSEIDTMLASSGATALKLEIVSELPTVNISTTTIYLVLKAVGSSGNIYNEYIYTNSAWELIGDTQLSLDNYALKSELPTKLSDLTNDLNLGSCKLRKWN